MMRNENVNESQNQQSCKASASGSLPCEQCDEGCYYHCTKGGQQLPECQSEINIKMEQIKKQIIDLLWKSADTVHGKGSCGELGGSFQAIDAECFSDIANEITNVIQVIFGPENQPNQIGKYSWIKYSHKKPEIGQEVLVCRDIESKQKYVTIWSLEDEKYADWNDVTFWAPILTPVE